MDQALRFKVQDIAEEVREWTQELSRKRGFHSDFDLNGYCAIASAELYKRLKQNGIQSEIHMASNDYGSHVFIVCEDHVVDVTATQFYRYKDIPVLIKHQRELQDYWAFMTYTVFDDPSKLRKAQVSWQWPQDQIAFAR